MLCEYLFSGFIYYKNSKMAKNTIIFIAIFLLICSVGSEETTEGTYELSTGFHSYADHPLDMFNEYYLFQYVMNLAMNCSDIQHMAPLNDSNMDAFMDNKTNSVCHKIFNPLYIFENLAGSSLNCSYMNEILNDTFIYDMLSTLNVYETLNESYVNGTMNYANLNGSIIQLMAVNSSETVARYIIYDMLRDPFTDESISDAFTIEAFAMMQFFGGYLMISGALTNCLKMGDFSLNGTTEDPSEANTDYFDTTGDTVQTNTDSVDTTEDPSGTNTDSVDPTVDPSETNTDSFDTTGDTMHANTDSFDTTEDPSGTNMFNEYYLFKYMMHLSMNCSDMHDMEPLSDTDSNMDDFMDNKNSSVCHKIFNPHHIFEQLAGSSLNCSYMNEILNDTFIYDMLNNLMVYEKLNETYMNGTMYYANLNDSIVELIAANSSEAMTRYIIYDMMRDSFMDDSMDDAFTPETFAMVQIFGGYLMITGALTNCLKMGDFSSNDITEDQSEITDSIDTTGDATITNTDSFDTTAHPSDKNVDSPETNGDQFKVQFEISVTYNTEELTEEMEDKSSEAYISKSHLMSEAISDSFNTQFTVTLVTDSTFSNGFQASYIVEMVTNNENIPIEELINTLSEAAESGNIENLNIDPAKIEARNLVITPYSPDDFPEYNPDSANNQVSVFIKTKNPFKYFSTVTLPWASGMAAIIVFILCTCSAKSISRSDRKQLHTK